MKMDEKVRDRVNILNKHRDKRVKLTRRLEKLRTKYDEQVKDAEEAAATDIGESVAAQVRQMYRFNITAFGREILHFDAHPAFQLKVALFWRISH